ncbi:MAG: (E)-4-hydroxy-3-methylbut-2-enyl-diphosphate synthase [Muribaculaceae bacterium]|nr:(E)-4-hydroxy-3-methylbut-2-enyl-diphosphate synthase [Muribaculaceae bacterium]
MSRYNYKRRYSHPVRVGSDVIIGGDSPIRIQSMTNTSTLDTTSSARQIARIAAEGAHLVRLTTQGVAEAENMAPIDEAVKALGVDIPLVADVHFNPKAAFTAARTCRKVRINPGNFVDAARTFLKLDFTDEEYAEEIQKIRDTFIPFLNVCRENNTAIRLGVNHGSLSDRIMSRYGDTPAGMVESVMEYLRIAVEENFHNIVISIKASNVVVMVATVRLLVREMEKEGMNFPLHLGVTEAGDGEDGRIKSAAGIGTLLAEGLGDTIRVSLSEPPENEIPVAIALRDYITAREGHAPVVAPDSTLSSADSPLRDKAVPADGLGKTPWPLVIGYDLALPDSAVSIDASSDPAVAIRLTGSPIILTSRHINPVGEMSAWMERYYQKGGTSPVIISLNYDDADKDIIRLKAAADFGALLLNGYANAISIHADALSADEVNLLALAILQACRLRFSKTEYIACPGCGRTLFRLQDTLAEVKRATSHLKGLKIGVMGCIVNGPGEMADADYGYVGAGPGRVSIYKGKTLINKNLPTADALPALIDLIKSNGDWKEPS